MDKWEYCWLRNFDAFSDEGIDHINMLGREGWEVVNFTGPGLGGLVIMFKRRLP